MATSRCTFRRRAARGFAVAVACTGVALTGAATAAASTSVDAVCPPAAPGYARCQAEIVVNSATGAAGTAAAAAQPAVAGASAPSAGSPAWLQWAYDLQNLSALGPSGPDTVAVVDPFGDSTAQSDLDAYRSMFGLPACDAGCFTKVNQSGVAGNYPADPTSAADFGWLTEDSIDLDMVSAICPTCHILFVEANSASDADLGAAEAKAASLGAQQISNSWSYTGSDNAEDPDFDPGNIAVVASSGDGGYDTFGIPAQLPYVTAAGGTSLRGETSIPPGDNSRGFGETAWSGTASGCANGVANGDNPVGLAVKPAWQQDSGCLDRTVSDLSADADSKTPVDAYGPYKQGSPSGLFSAGGTSVASPIIAAYYALIGGGAGVGGAAWAYANSSFLNDITSGNDGSCSPTATYLCTAVPGYDGPTGVGSISGDAVAGPPQPAGSYAPTATATTATLAGGVYANDHDTQAYWQWGPTASYTQQTAITDLGGATGVSPIGATITGLTPSTTYHFRLVATSCAGTTYGYDATLNTPAATTSTTTSSTTSTTSSSTSSSSSASGTPCATTTATTTVSTSTSTPPPPPAPPVTQVTATAPVPTVNATAVTSSSTTSQTTETTDTTHAVTPSAAILGVTVTTSVRRKGNLVRVSVRCSRRCAGTVQLHARGHVIGQTKIALRNKGFSALVSIPLNALGRRLVPRSHGRLDGTVTLALNGYSIRRGVVILSG